MRTSRALAVVALAALAGAVLAVRMGPAPLTSPVLELNEKRSLLPPSPAKGPELNGKRSVPVVATAPDAARPAIGRSAVAAAEPAAGPRRDLDAGERDTLVEIQSLLVQ